VLTECKPLPMPKFQPKVIQDSNPDCRINPDLDVCQISPKMLWIHYLVSISRFAKFRKNQDVTVWEMLINLLKSPILQWWEKWKSDPEYVSGTGAPPKVNQFFQLVGSITTPSYSEIGSLNSSVILLTEWHTQRKRTTTYPPPCWQR